MNFRKRSQRKKYGLPIMLNDEWLAKVVHCSDEKLPPAFDKDGKYIDLNIDDILPMKELPDGLFAYYKIVNIKYKRGGDWLYATDAYDYDLKFSHIGDFKIRWENQQYGKINQNQE